MSISNVSSIDSAKRLTSSTPKTLERVQGDFSQHMQSALKALDDQDASVREAVAPLVAQLTQTVELVLAQLQAPQAQSEANTAPATSTTTAQVQDADSNAMVQAPPAVSRDYLLPGEPGAGLPANYLKSPLYQDWLAQKPQMGENVTEFGQALSAWQKANPYYINPDRFETFDGYLSAVQSSTTSDNLPAQADPARYASFVSSYYGATATTNPWGDRLGHIQPQEMLEWSEDMREQYDQALAAQRSLQAR